MEKGQTLKVRYKTHGTCNNPTKLIVKTYTVEQIFTNIIDCRRIGGKYLESFQHKEIRERDGVLYIDVMSKNEADKKEKLAKKKRKQAI